MSELTAAQVASRLGVKRETVYAYVSRGLLRRTRAPSGRGSRFDTDEVERLAARTGRGGAGRAATSGPQVRTALTLIADGRLYYRGRDAVGLAGEHSFEAVAGWLWTGRLDPAARFTAPPELVAPARAAAAGLPASVRLTDRLRVILTLAAAGDPLRFHTDPAAVSATAATLLATMVEALPPRGAELPDPRLAARLWPRLTAQPATPAGIEALNAALVLVADHDLAASTVAARVAASTRAHPYAVVSAGLAAFDGPLHGLAASHAYRVIAEAVEVGDAVAVYSERLRTDARVPGFDPHIHRVYPDADVRGAALLDRLAGLPAPAAVRGAIEGLIAAAQARAPRSPNLDFALAALAHAAGMSVDAGEAIFAIGRTAGWLAHALEEYQEPGLRFRLTGSYTGPPPAAA